MIFLGEETYIFISGAGATGGSLTCQLRLFGVTFSNMVLNLMFQETGPGHCLVQHVADR